MWKDYSCSYIKNNRASSISVMVAAFISALLLSLLCSLFYNLWNYEIDKLKLEEGDWQSRIVGEISDRDLTIIQDFANVEKIVINEKLSDRQEIAVDIYFENMSMIFEDMPRIIALLEHEPKSVTYHYTLLAMYFIRDPQDKAPRAVFPFFLAVTVMTCFSLIMIIHNSFAVSMNARLHQFGIFSSIGATPGQIRTCLLQEAAALCIVPIVAGNLLGIVMSNGIIKGTNKILTDTSGRMDAVWTYHPFILVITLLITVLTIWISAWIPARKLSKLMPLEAIKNTGELQLKKKKSFRTLSFLFGIEGELARTALKAQRKNLRTATFSLTFSFLAFSLMQCFFTLTGISQRMTYFARYQDVWDIMVTIKDTNIDVLKNTEYLQKISGVRSKTIYQKVMAKRNITEEEISENLRAIGGLQDAPETYVSDFNGAWLVNAPIVILDDASFLEYCEQIGTTPRLDGAVILNRIKDSSNPNFRIRNYIPYINENQQTTVLQQADGGGIMAEIPVISYTQNAPLLREAYDELDYYVLVHVLPVSVWKEINDLIGGTEDATYIRILAKEGVTLTELNELEDKISQIFSQKYEIESENRIQDKLSNDNMITGMMLILGGFCVLLAIIGIGNVFSNTLGFVHQRKREFARYMSIGLTPEGIKKMFCIEALVIAGRPILITLPLTIIVTGLMIKIAYLEPMIFIREMPIIAIAAFILAVFAIVAFAYYLGGRKVLQNSLVDALRDDTMM